MANFSAKWLNAIDHLTVSNQVVSGVGISANKYAISLSAECLKGITPKI